VANEDQIEIQATAEVENDDRPIKEIIKDSAKKYARAKGRQAFFWAVANMKAQDKEKGKKTKIPKKSVSALRPGDLTEHGQVVQVGRHPTERGSYQVTFMGDQGSLVENYGGRDKLIVVSRREIKS
jgi:hypothetical protein